MVLSLLRPQWYTSLFHLCTTRDSFPVRVLMGILHVILSLLQVYWRWLYACYKCVCVLHVTWPPLHVLNICPCAYCPWFCPRYTSLSPISLFPDCAAHDLVNYCCFYNNSPRNDPRVSLNIKGVNFSPVINVHKTIRPTGWLYLLLKEAYHKLPRKPKDEN